MLHRFEPSRTKPKAIWRGQPDQRRLAGGAIGSADFRGRSGWVIDTVSIVTKETPKPAKGEQYSDVVERLRNVVEALEGGELSLEQSLEKFGEGIALVKRGEKLLGEAEKRVEQLLSDEGRTQAIDAPPPSPSAPGAGAPRQSPRRSPPPPQDEDVPF